MNTFDIRARERERIFFKRIKAGGVFRTGSGRTNTIVSTDANVLYIRTERSRKPFAIKRDKLRGAIKYLLEERTATRKDLEKQAKYNSALMGLLWLIFADISRVKRTLRGLLRLTLTDIRHVFSGLARAPRDMEMVAAFGGVEILVSYFHIRNDKNARWKHHLSRLNLRCMIDSGAFSCWVVQSNGKSPEPISIEEYASFLRLHQDVIKSAINLDAVGDAAASKQNLQHLRSQGLPIPIIPVWHVQSPMEELDELVRNDEPVIAIGGSAFLSNRAKRAIFETIFERYPNQAFHLLGGTSPVIAEFPWFSCDSTSYLVGRKYHKLVTPTLQMPAPNDWSSLEALEFNIREMASMEGNYSRSYGWPMIVKHA